MSSATSAFGNARRCAASSVGRFLNGSSVRNEEHVRPFVRQHVRLAVGREHRAVDAEIGHGLLRRRDAQ